MPTIDERLAVLEKAVELEIKTLREARDLQAKEYERRLESLNNEASRLRAMQATYLPREVYESQHTDICKKIVELDINRAHLAGKASQTSVILAWGLSLLGLIIGMVAIIMK